MNEESGEFPIKDGWVQEMSIQRKTYSVTGGPHKHEIKMKEEYEFPYNNWYLKFEECDRELVDNWRINIIKFSNTPCPGNMINYSGWVHGGALVGAGEGRWGWVLITIDQFKQYVLNINPKPTLEENYDYLIPLIKQYDK